MHIVSDRERQNWWRVKGKIVSKYGSVAAAARQFHCHRNTVRMAASGMCRRVADQMKKAGVL
jgi:hypothetical protein